MATHVPWYNKHGEVFSVRNIPTLLVSPSLYCWQALLAVLLVYRASLLEWVGIVASWFVIALGALVVNHRYFSHQSFSTSRPLRFVLGIISCLGLQKGPLWWSSKHRRHHRACDEPNDPHSWTQTSFLFAWVGWYMSREEQKVDIEYLHPSVFVQSRTKPNTKVIAPELEILDNLHLLPFIAVHLLLAAMGYSSRTIFLFYTAPTLWVPLPILLFNVMFHPATDAKACKAVDIGADVLSALLGEAEHDDHHRFPMKAHRPGLKVMGHSFDPGWHFFLAPMLQLGLIWNVKEHGCVE